MRKNTIETLLKNWGIKMSNSKHDFKKAVDTANQTVKGLVQPKSFLSEQPQNKTWEEYAAEIEQQQEHSDQAFYSIVMEPAMKEAIQTAGKKKGRSNGGVKSIVRDALLAYFKKHPELFE